MIREGIIQTVKLGEKEMDWFRFGREKGPKLVILPGVSLKSVMGSKDAVIGAYSLLAEDYDIYLLDRIRVFPEDYDVRQMAEDSLRALRAIGLYKVHLMGVSQGGMITMMMAIREPEAVQSMTLCSTSAKMEDSAALEAWMKLAEERNLPALMEAFGEAVYTPSFYAKYKDLIIASGAGAEEQDFRNFIISLRGTAGFDCLEELQGVRCPCFVIGASEDRVVGAEASIALSERLQCERFIYEGYGHAVYDEAPDYLTHIKAFLDGQSGNCS